MEMNVEKRRGRRKPKKRWLDVIGCDMRTAKVCVDDVEDRSHLTLSEVIHMSYPILTVEIYFPVKYNLFIFLNNFKNCLFFYRWIF